MPALFFWTFSAIMLLFAVLVVVNRSPVASALCLVMSFLGLAALFVTLNAYFIGVIQVLVYAGAVMVLFLFIIMLLDLQAERRRKLNYLAVGGGAVVALAFAVQIKLLLLKFPQGDQPFPPLAQGLDDVRGVGEALFSQFNLPFQVVGVLVLVATIGVVVLSKKELH